MKGKNILFVFLIVLFSMNIYARQLTIDYNNALTRSTADDLYCLRGGDCVLNNLILNGNISFIGSIINITIVNQRVNGTLTVDGNLEVDNLTADTINTSIIFTNNIRPANGSGTTLVLSDDFNGVEALGATIRAGVDLRASADIFTILGNIFTKGINSRFWLGGVNWENANLSLNSQGDIIADRDLILGRDAEIKGKLTVGLPNESYNKCNDRGIGLTACTDIDKSGTCNEVDGCSWGGACGGNPGCDNFFSELACDGAGPPPCTWTTACGDAITGSCTNITTVLGCNNDTSTLCRWIDYTGESPIATFYGNILIRGTETVIEPASPLKIRANNTGLHINDTMSNHTFFINTTENTVCFTNSSKDKNCYQWINIVSDSNASNCGNGEYLDGNGICINFNETVEALFVSTTYNASYVNSTYTIDQGNLASIQTAKDGNSFNVSEIGGSSGVIIVNFTNVEDFTSVLLRMAYDGSHEIHFGIYECDDDYYEEEYGEVMPSSELEFYSISVWDASDHICDGTVSFQFNHDENGNPSDNIYLDYIVLIDGFSTTTNNQHNLLTNLKWEDSGHTGNLELDGNLNVTGINMSCISSFCWINKTGSCDGFSIGTTCRNETSIYLQIE